MELRVLQYFLAVAREQSISGAAESLHLTQPTLSTQLKALEDELGKQLLIRGTKGSRRVTLTEEGMILRRRAEEILDLVDKTEREISVADETVAGDVHIGAAESTAFSLLARCADIVREQCPLVHFHISSGDRADTLDRLDRGLIDFALIFGEVDTARYNFLSVPHTDRWGALVRRDHPLASKGSVTAADIAGERLIISRQEFQGSALQRFLGKNRDELDIAATYTLCYNGSLMAEQGLGIALTLDGIVNVTGDSALTFLPFEPELTARLSVVWNKYQILPRASSRYLQCMREEFAGANVVDYEGEER